MDIIPQDDSLNKQTKLKQKIAHMLTHIKPGHKKILEGGMCENDMWEVLT